MSVLTGLATRAATVATGGSGPLVLAGIALAAGIGVGGAGAWWLQGNRYAAQIGTLTAEHAVAMQKVSDAAAADLAAKLAQLTHLQALVSDLDDRNYKELQDAQAESARLRAAVADGTRRLSVAARCPDSGGSNGVPNAASPGGVGAGTVQRVELDPAAAGRILAIGADGDKVIRQLQACQEYARTIAAPR